MPRTWIVVAESSRARIFEAASTQDPIREIAELDRPEARMHEQELTSDQSGRRFATAGPTRHGMTSAVRWKDQHAARFARELGAHLAHAHEAGRYDRLFLAAGPRFLGLLREALTPATAAVVAGQYDRNWIHDDPATIRGHLPEFF